MEKKSEADLSSEGTGLPVRRLKATALLFLIVLAVAASIGWYIAYQAALQADAQRAEVCDAVFHKMAEKLIVLIVAAQYGKYENYEQSAIVLNGYLGVLEECPQPPLDDSLLGTLSLILSYTEVGDTGLWQNATALQTLATGLDEARDFMLANEKQAALDRLLQLREDLRAMGFGIP